MSLFFPVLPDRALDAMNDAWLDIWLLEGVFRHLVEAETQAEAASASVAAG